MAWELCTEFAEASALLANHGERRGVARRNLLVLEALRLRWWSWLVSPRC